MLKRKMKLGVAMALGLSLLGACQSVGSVETMVSPIDKMKTAIETAKASSGDGDLAIWLLEDADTKVYMMGTVHILPDGINWRTSELDGIISTMDTLYTEADTSSEAEAAGQQLMMKYAMFDDGQTLSGVLGDDIDVVTAAFDGLGMPLANFDGFKPWMGTVTLQVMSLMKDGYNVESGVETVLEAAAKDAGAELKYLETIEEQLQFISGGSIEQQVEALVFTASTMDLGKEVMDTILAEWVDGDIDGLSAIVASPKALGSQDMYDRLLVERNTNWVPLIEGILDEPGVKLVAVGAAHLAGPDSVITMLENKGHKVQVFQ